MPKKKSPRRGSMQFWPRKRAASETARVHSWPAAKEAKLLGFAGYKVGMTHILAQDNKSTSMTKGEEVQVPVTIVECPPVKVFGVRVYTKDAYGLHCAGQITAEKLDKELERVIIMPKKKSEAKTENIVDVRVLVHTQPKLTGIGKKKPEIFEIAVGGTTPEEKLAYAKSVLGQEVKVTDALGEGQLVDSVSVTTGRGFQGPVKRFGVNLRHHKSEKVRRGPGSLGPWHGPKMYRVAHAGQTGYHQRLEFNKFVVKIGDDPKDVNAKGGFIRYGEVKNPYLLVYGSLGGPAKRLITFTAPRRAKKTTHALDVKFISKASKQR